MLKHLYIRNYALFKEVEVDFSSGLNVLTGETGAGKSMLIGALGLIMGKRADNSMIFYDEERCIVEAEFAELPQSVLNYLEQHEELDWEEGELIIRREIRPNGKSRAFINDSPASLQTLKDLSLKIVDLHGQHQNHEILKSDIQTQLLDAFAGSTSNVESFKQAFHALQKLRKEIKTKKAKDAEAQSQLDFLLHQSEELSAMGPAIGEEQSLEEEFELLQHSEELREALGHSIEHLYDREESTIYEQLGDVLQRLEKPAQMSSGIQAETVKLKESQEILQEVVLSLKHIMETIESDPSRLSVVEERMGLYHSMKLKYRLDTGDDLVQKLEDIGEEIHRYKSLEEEIRTLEKEEKKACEQLIKLGLGIEKLRKSAKPKLEQQIVELLQEVGFNKARFEIGIERLSSENGYLEIGDEMIKPESNGINKVYFLIQTNPGAPAGLLNQIASGGEISRVMLAIKTALAGKSDFPVLVFDEIDTGISGEVANKVGNLMRQLGASYQILSITHLPQIAARGAHHFEIIKETDGTYTNSHIKRLSDEERVRHIASMISGEAPTNSALQNATELLQS